MFIIERNCEEQYFIFAKKKYGLFSLFSWFVLLF